MIDIDRWDAMCLTLQQVRLQIGPDSACVRRYEATKHGKGRSHSEPASARTTHAHAHTHHRISVGKLVPKKKLNRRITGNTHVECLKAMVSDARFTQHDPVMSAFPARPILSRSKKQQHHTRAKMQHGRLEHAATRPALGNDVPWMLMLNLSNKQLPPVISHIQMQDVTSIHQVIG